MDHLTNKAGLDGLAPLRIDGLLQRITGHAPAALSKTSPARKRHWLGIIERQLQRERNKGVARHWSYDLNRHIALKAAHTKLRGMLEPGLKPDDGERQGAMKRQGSRRSRCT